MEHNYKGLSSNEVNDRLKKGSVDSLNIKYYGNKEKQWKKENKGHRCTLNTLDFIEQDSKHIELIIKCYNTLSKQYESPYKLSMDNKVNLVIDKNDTLKLKQLSEMVALQNIVESSGNETPKDYRQELVNLVSGNKELLSYAVDSNIFSLEEIK